MALQDINSLEELLTALDQYVKTPKRPGLTGAEFNVLLKKILEFAPGNGSSTSALTFTLDGGDVIAGGVELSDRESDEGSIIPDFGSFPSGVRIYVLRPADEAEDPDVMEDYSQVASFNPSTQVLFAGLTGSEILIKIKLTF